MKKQIRGTVILLLCTLIWGLSFVAQSVGVEMVEPFTFQAVRCVLAVVGLIPICIISDLLKGDGKGFFTRFADKKLWLAGVLCGIPLFLGSSLQQHGLLYTDAGKAAFLTAMYIIIVPIMGLFLGRKPSKMIPLCVILAAAGLYCLSCAGVTQIGSGDIMLILGAFAFALQIIMIDLFGLEVDALRLNMIQALVCAVISLVCMLIWEEPSFDAIIRCRWPLAYAGVLSMGIAFYLQILGQKDLEPSAASVMLSTESVFAVIFGAIILQETMTLWEWLGCGLMLAAVILAQVKTGKRDEKKAGKEEPEIEG